MINKSCWIRRYWIRVFRFKIDSNIFFSIGVVGYGVFDVWRLIINIFIRKFSFRSWINNFGFVVCGIYWVFYLIINVSIEK